MKKNDIAVLIIVIAFAGGISYFIGQALIGKNVGKPVDVEVARPISAEITQPDKTIFNAQAINPTVQITISDNTQNPIGN